MKFFSFFLKEKMIVRFKKLTSDAVSPTRGTALSTGMDITLIRVVKQINSNTTMYGTGLSIFPPDGYYTELVPRSSIVKTGYMMANSIGIIDNDYRGELMIVLTKTSPEVPDLVLPNRLIQLVLRKFENYEMEEGELNDTERGYGGFGSTK